MTTDFEKELESLINRHSAENFSDTPDFILANYLTTCLRVFGYAVTQREQWYGRGPQPAQNGPMDDARIAAASALPTPDTK